MWLQYSLTSLEFINQLDILFKRSAATLKRWVKAYCNMVSKKLEFFCWYHMLSQYYVKQAGFTDSRYTVPVMM